ncbi:carbohydrate ABC transporter permease [Streptomyces rubrogriseus]|uniref:carbohydrate ABC transporter permease n=1 Tax=Streptomyces rubrogriseus TaxID=194673 RepID=UPI00158205BE|nr:carbohydrate ABC transporter permease [Streptomyces rubrogriseus]
MIAELSSASAWSLPTTWEWSNYTEAWTTGHIGLYVQNSLLAVVPALALMLLLGTAAGFALQAMVWKGRSLTLLVFLAGMMVPPQMILLPLFTVYYQTACRHPVAADPHLHRHGPPPDRWSATPCSPSAWCSSSSSGTTCSSR